MTDSTPLQQLEADLRACVGTDGVFRLRKNTLSSSSINALFGLYVPEEGEIAVSGASVGIPVGLDFVQVSGNGAAEPFERATISAQFTIDAQAEMVLTATAAPDWNLATAFPSFAGQDPERLEFDDGSRFVLSTVTQGTVEKGLVFRGPLRISGLLQKFTNFFPSGPLSSSATIDRIDDGRPEMRLTAPSGKEIEIGTYRLKLEVRLESTAASGYKSIVVGSGLRYGDASDEELIIGARAPYDQPSVVLVADPGDQLLGLPQLAKLLEGTIVGGVFPTQFPILDRFGFAGWVMQVNPVLRTVNSIRLDVSTTQPWPLTPRLVLDPLSFTFTWTPADPQPMALTVTARVAIKQDGDPAQVQITAYYPSFAFDGRLVPGVPLKLPALGQFISDDAAAHLPELRVTDLSLSATPPSGSFSFGVTVEGDFPIVGNLTLVMVKFGLSRLADNVSALIAGKVDLTGDETYLEASAAYNGTSGWLFSGSLTDATISFSELAQRFFPTFQSVDLGTLHINEVSVAFNSSTTGYKFFIDAELVLELAEDITLQFGVIVDVQSGQVALSDPLATRRFLAPPRPLPDEMIARLVDENLMGEPGVLTGTISGSVSFNNLVLSVTAVLPEGGGKPSYRFSFMGANGALDAGVLSLTFEQPTLGAMVETLVNAAVPGQNFSLSAPWSVLNSIPLEGLTFTIDFNKGSQKAGLTKSLSSLDFGFVSIREISLFYNIDVKANQPRVEFRIERGSFLGKEITPETAKTWDVLNPSSAPQTPGLGSGVFDLRFLAIGQHIEPTTQLDTRSVVTAVEGLHDAFKKSTQIASTDSPISGTKLQYADQINWMLGLDATILGTLTLRAIFLDPELYGVAIALDGDKAGPFKTLRFEILYKKVNDRLGVYQIELTVPDAFRQLEFGQVSITLPVIRIWIFTNGDFKIDFGFPENESFARSFALQILPFLGAGGFYLGVLSGDSSSRVPVSTRGNFAPVIELGLGFRIGIGKEINKGILSAGLSVTLQGITEGAFATFNPYPGQSIANDLFYYWIRGKFAIVGNIYGEINFAIISARLDITVTIGVALEMEIYKPVTFGFEAQVSVRLTVKVNLGIFKININLSFDMGISETFTIGTGQTAPWADVLPSAREQRILAATRTSLSEDACPEIPPAPNWLLVKPATPVPLQILFAPQITSASKIAGGVAGASTAQLVTMLYARTTVAGDLATPAPFDELARASLIWAIAASLFDGSEVSLQTVLDCTVTADDLRLLYCALAPKGVGQPFTADQVHGFFSSYFAVTIDPAPTAGAEIQASFVPMFPWMRLERPDGTTFSFDDDNTLTSTELDAIRTEFNELEVRYRDQGTGDSRQAPVDEISASMATFMFVDFFAMLARATVQLAIDELRTTSIAGEWSLAALADAHPEWGVSVTELARANQTRRLREGLVLSLPPFRRRLHHGEGLVDVAARFGVRVEDLEPHVTRLSSRRGPTAVTIRGAHHEVAGDSPRTLLEIARRYGLTAEELAVENRHQQQLFAGDRISVVAIESMNVAALLDLLQNKGRFEQLSGLAARVFLQGLRPSWKGTPTALFEISGQQFDGSALVAGSRFSLVATASWIRFSGGADRLPVTIGVDEAALIQSFNGATLSPTFSATLQPFDRVEPKRFTLSNAIVWRPQDVPRFRNNQKPATAPVEDPTIWNFPDNLQQLLTGYPSLRPKVTINDEVVDVLAASLDPGEYSWAMTFDVVVRRVPSAATPGQTLPFTYDFLGTNDVGGLLLQNLVSNAATFGPAIDQIYILFTPQPGDAPPPLGLTSRPVAGTTFFLLQTNLSTVSNPPGELPRSPRERMEGTSVDPLGQTPIDFLKYAWEASVVRSGGYQLYYRHTAEGASVGLPDYLFEQSSEVTITIAVTFAITDNVLESFLNALIVYKPVDYEKTVFFLAADSGDPRLLDRIVTMPPGNAGFEVVRTVDELAVWERGATLPAETAAAGLDQLYNLLGYQIAKTGTFRASPFGLALTPIEEAGGVAADPDRITRVPIVSGATEWRYRASIPVSPFFDGSSGAWLTASTLPPESDDPYRGIGQTAKIALDFQDMFGNRIASDAAPYLLDVPLAYYDDLIGVDAWPSVVTSFEVSRQASLILNFSFDNDRYSGTGEDVRRRIVADRQQYALIYYQISRDVDIAATTTLDPSMTLDLTAILVKWVGDIYTYLTELFEGSSPATRVQPIAPFAALTDSSGKSLFALRTEVTITRTSSVDESSAQRPGGSASAVVCSIGPKAQKKPPTAGTTTDDDPLTLAVFADALEQAFPQLKVATGRPPSTADDRNPVRDVWLVRFAQAGFSYSFQPARYFAIPPLARAPLSRTGVSLHVYGSDKPLKDQPTIVESSVNIDMDLLAREFLALMDLFLSPDYVLPAWLLVHASQPAENPIAKILEAKRAIAAAIGAKLAPVYKEQAMDAPAPATVDRLTQELLITLSQAYEVDAIVEVPATGAAPDRVQLWGKPVVPNSDATSSSGEVPSYSLSTASFPLFPGASSSVLPFTFTSRDKTAASVVSLPLVYRVNALQHEMKAPIEGYVPSSWLSFVIPLTRTTTAYVIHAMSDGGSLGTVDIPVPLRAFPTPPTMVSQTGKSSGTVNRTSLSEARLWDYAFTYEHASAAQDRIHAAVLFNVSQGAEKTEQNGPDLLDALLQYHTAAAGLRRDLDSSVLRQQNPAVGLVAVQSLSWIATRIADAWPAWKQPRVSRGVPSGPQLATQTVRPFDDQLVVSETAIDVGTEKGVLEISIARTAGSFAGPLPRVEIDGCSSEPAPSATISGTESRWVFKRGESFLTFREAGRIPARALRYERLDILAFENASAGVSVGRNEAYDGKPGNEPFIYRTPEVRFVNDVTPLLTPEVDIDIATFTPDPPATAKLETYLANFFDALFDTAPGAELGERLIRLGATYEHDMNGFAVGVPIFLSLPLEMSATSAKIHEVATFVMTWFNDRELVGRSGRLRIELAVFASLSDTNVPILRLGNLHLDTSRIWEATVDHMRKDND